MTHRPAHRLAAWLMALLLALVAMEPLRAHDCPMHGLAVAPRSGTAATADTHASHASHASHAAARPAGEHGHPADAPHQCNCLGDCGLTALVALAPQPTEHFAAAVVEPAPPLGAEPAVAAPAPEHVLPFANGPPARV